MDEMAHEAGMSEERAQKAMVDAARLADELRTEQELAVRYERERKLLEAQVKDIVTRCDDAEQNALKVIKHISSSLSFPQHEIGFINNCSSKVLHCHCLFFESDPYVSGRKESSHQDGN